MIRIEVQQLTPEGEVSYTLGKVMLTDEHWEGLRKFFCEAILNDASLPRLKDSGVGEEVPFNNGVRDLLFHSCTTCGKIFSELRYQSLVSSASTLCAGCGHQLSVHQPSVVVTLTARNSACVPLSDATKTGSVG
jgi:hypothetical protein